MTTIACSRTEMACDSRTSWDSGEFFCCDDKIERIGPDLVGCAGSTASIFKFLEWYRAKGERPEMDGENFSALVLNAAGIWIYTNSTYPSRVCERFYTIGSGGMAAQAAMFCGKSPAEAVAIAIKCDKHSGGRVRNFPLKVKP